MSMSRSFLLGAFFIIGILSFISIFFGTKKAVTIPIRIIQMIFLSIFSVFLVWGVIKMPIFTPQSVQEMPFYETSSSVNRDAAISSRWNLLTPLWNKIKVSPVIGAGFGTSVSYYSADPRIAENGQPKLYTTYRFEWGWLDIWLKMGLIGLIGFFVFLYQIIYYTKATIQHYAHRWLIAGLMSSVIGLFVVNIFTPFINHPLGITLLLFILPFIDFDNSKGKFEKTKKNGFQKPQNKLVIKPVHLRNN
ncbi:hypothetical protein D6827_03695 [Candidatus Parcubacteria bacterium]|nr:MAG: hypothetical protein D6827_03695 [Candidatus Parcubacteria bacterium]